MELTLNQQAISLAALMFVRGSASFESSLHDEEISALQVLKQVKAVVPGVVNSQDALCAFCGLYRGPIFRTDDGLMVQCPDCGPFALDPASQRNWRLDDEWLIRKLRGALDISPQATTAHIADGVWDIGRYKKRPVVLARRIDLVERHGLRIFHGLEPRSQSWVITPRPLVRQPLDPLMGMATWWQLEDRFALHGFLWCIRSMRMRPWSWTMASTTRTRTGWPWPFLSSSPRTGATAPHGASGSCGTGCAGTSTKLCM